MKGLQKILNKKGLKKKLKSTAVIFSGKSVGIVSGLFLNYIIARTYGAGTIGEYSLFLSFTNIYSMVVLLGLNRSTLRSIPDIVVKGLSVIPWMRGNFRVLLLSQILFLIPAYIVILYNQDYFLESPYAHFTLVIVFGVIVRSFKEFSLSATRGFLKVWPYALGQGSMNFFILLILVLDIYFIKTGLHPNIAIVIALLIDALIYSLYLIILIAKYEQRPVKKNLQHIHMKHVVKDSLPFYWTTLMNFLTLQGGIYFLRFFHTLEDVSFFSLATRYAFIINMIYMTVKGYTSPQLAHFKATGEIKELIREARMSTKLVLSVSIPLSVILIIGTPYLLILHGEVFIKSYVPFIIVMIGLLVKALFGAGDNFLNMTGHQKEVKNINLISFIFFLASNLILIPAYSYTGAALSFSLALITRHAQCSYYIRKLYGRKIGYITI